MLLLNVQFPAGLGALGSHAGGGKQAINKAGCKQDHSRCGGPRERMGGVATHGGRKKQKA